MDGLYGKADLAFLSGKVEDASVKATCLNIGAGYDFFLSKKFAIEPSLSYLFSLSASMEDIDFTIGMLSINIGFIYLF